MKLGTPFLALAACGAFAMPGCGSDSDDGTTTTAPKPKTPTANTEAIREIVLVRAGLDEALDQLRSGDAKAAEDTVSETYLRHFELVEGPLDRVDHELNEELEETIRDELRKKIAGGAEPAAVSKLVDEVKDDLASAEAKLK
ncbi:MAG TPA: hypothetical protein VJT75_13650 [Thermoleophilaceae bacterium]|nr:hypothetical protein [Thermoleophilaceae bacterium]